MQAGPPPAAFAAGQARRSSRRLARCTNNRPGETRSRCSRGLGELFPGGEVLPFRWNRNYAELPTGRRRSGACAAWSVPNAHLLRDPLWSGARTASPSAMLTSFLQRREIPPVTTVAAGLPRRAGRAAARRTELKKPKPSSQPAPARRGLDTVTRDFASGRWSMAAGGRRHDTNTRGWRTAAHGWQAAAVGIESAFLGKLMMRDRARLLTPVLTRPRYPALDEVSRACAGGARRCTAVKVG